MADHVEDLFDESIGTPKEIEMFFRSVRDSAAELGLLGIQVTCLTRKVEDSPGDKQKIIKMIRHRFGTVIDPSLLVDLGLALMESAHELIRKGQGDMINKRINPNPNPNTN